MTTPADAAANTAFNELTAGVDFDIEIADISGAAYQAPAAAGPLFDAIPHLTTADLTTGVVGGTGTFDVLMKSFGAHLKGEMSANRINGGEYTKAYTALTEAAMANAVQFLMGKDAAYWQAITAQIQAQTAQTQLVQARVALEVAKAELQRVRLEAQGAKATYALTKLKLATEGVAYDTTLYTLTTMLPQQLALVKEQTDAQRAQTLDTRTDGTAVAGAMGKQKELYTQQIRAYETDGKSKIAKLFTDAWITQKSMDEGTVPPAQFSNANLDTILSNLRAAVDLD